MTNYGKTKEAIDRIKAVIRKAIEIYPCKDCWEYEEDINPETISRIADHLCEKISPIDDVSDIGSRWIEKQIREAVELEEEKTEYQVGDLLYCEEEDSYDLVRSNSDSYPDVGEQDEGGLTPHADTLNFSFEKVGSFKPTKEALEKVTEWVRGELVIEEFEDTNNTVGLWTGTMSGNLDYDVNIENGEKRVFDHAYTIRTGIIIDFHQLADE